jgi:hypothetical protein
VIGEVDSVGDGVDESVDDSLGDSGGDELWDGVGESVGASVADGVAEGVGSVGSGEADPVGAADGDGSVDVGTPDGEGPVVPGAVGDVGSAVVDGVVPSPSGGSVAEPLGVSTGTSPRIETISLWKDSSCSMISVTEYDVISVANSRIRFQTSLRARSSSSPGSPETDRTS